MKNHDAIEKTNTDDLLIFTNTKGNKGIMNIEGEIIIPPKYDYMVFNDNLIIVKLNDKYGIIDRNDKEVISIKYDNMDNYFSNGLLSAKLNGKWGYIDKNGKPIIPFIYDERGHMFDKIILVKLNNEVKYINLQGEDISIQISKYDDNIYPFCDDTLFRAKLNGKYGIIDITGKEVVPFKYKYIGYAYNKNNDLIFVTDEENHEGAINSKGKEIIPLIFNNIEILNGNYINSIIAAYHGISTYIYDRKGSLISIIKDCISIEKN